MPLSEPITLCVEGRVRISEDQSKLPLIGGGVASSSEVHWILGKEPIFGNNWGCAMEAVQ